MFQAIYINFNLFQACHVLTKKKKRKMKNDYNYDFFFKVYM